MTYYLGEVVEQEDGELAIQLPINMLNQMGWDEQTLLEWLIDEEEEAIYIREKSDGKEEA